MNANGSKLTTGRAIPSNLRPGSQLLFPKAQVLAELAVQPELNEDTKQTLLLLRNLRLSLKSATGTNGDGISLKHFKTRKDGLTEITLGTERVQFEFDELKCQSDEDLKLTLQRAQAEISRRESARPSVSSK